MGEKRRILMLPQAESDLRMVADPVYSEICSRIQLLAEFPELGPKVPAATPGWRALHVRMFRIIYRVKPRDIEIVFVRHCARGDSHSAV